MRFTKTLITAALALALFALPASALAKRGDRDHDRMPDKWEKRHHLNVHANDARKDPDHDGLSNLSEFRHHTDPRKADTDNDGIDDQTEVEDHMNPTHDDADEFSGTVTSFSGGVLTIQPAAQGSAPVSGRVTDATQIECDDSAPVTATASDHGSDDGGSNDSSGPGSGSDDNSGTTSSGSDDGANHDVGDDNGGETENENENEGSCTSANLVQGARVHEAKLVDTSDGPLFTKIELVPAA